MLLLFLCSALLPYFTNMSKHSESLFKMINLPKRGYVTVLSLVTILFSCSKVDSLLPDEDEDDIPILWSVYSVDEINGTSSDNGVNSMKTKALISSYPNLRDACAQDEDGCEKIGLFGEYSLDGSDIIVFDDTDLWWWEKENGNPYDDVIGDRNYWNYGGEDRHWKNGATYNFRAYFPKSKVSLQPGSDSDNIFAVYDTETSQYDLLVASRRLLARSENPVMLSFSHALAALRFTFQFSDDGVTDNLTACWLENVKDDGFYTRSTLNFGEEIFWPKSTANVLGAQMYYWEPINPLQITSASTATAYSTSAPVGRGSQYTENEGWLLVIPQQCPGPQTLQLCFRTYTGAEVVYRVGLPAVEFENGNRYTFNIKISSTDIKLSLSIAEWNMRNASYEIDLNN